MYFLFNHLIYFILVVGWDGEQSALSRSLDEDRKRSNDRKMDDEYDDEFDEGRVSI